MAIKKRFIMVGLLLALASMLYGAARHYSDSLMLYVVEQSLIQKAPSEIDRTDLHKRLHALLSSAPDKRERMDILLRISRYLEKVQSIAPGDVDKLLAIERR